MLKIKKMQKRLEVKDVVMQDLNPCYVYYDNYDQPGLFDCLSDCHSGKDAYVSPDY